jgi:HNH endonuclease
MIKSVAQSLKSYLPSQEKKVYPPVGKCIYCGSTDDLTMEHVIPYGFGGRIELPEASCRECAKITSNFEHTCLRTMYGPLRLLYGMPSRRKKSRPSTLPLKIKRTASEEWSYTDIEQGKYPFLILFPYFTAPLALSKPPTSENRGAATDRFWIRGASPAYVFNDLLATLVRELGVHSIMPEAKAHVAEFCQMLSKIAYSYAVGELGHESFEPYLLPGILKAELSDCDSYIGSLEKDEPPSASLHELALGNSMQRSQIVVRVRLLCKLGTPTYFVVVGRKNHEKC